MGTLSELIGIARECKGWTLRDLEKASGVSNPLISQIETGKVRDPGFTTVIRLCDALGITLDRAATAERSKLDVLRKTGVWKPEEPGIEAAETTETPNIDPEFIVIIASAWANDSGIGVNYSFDGERFNNRADAIKHGFELRESDDFNIGHTYGDDLIWFGWMDERIDEPEETAREIAEQIGLTFDPRWYRLKYSKASGRVIAA
jgi:transcriptional regulator with XRE-family HTH domain